MNVWHLRQYIERYPKQHACFIFELIQGEGGVNPATKEYLQGLRDWCDENNLVLIFDEVFVGFRLAPGGAQEYFGVQADMVTYGKTLGGGLPAEAAGTDVVIATRSRVLALNRRAASSGGHRIGTVTTMRDSTELASMRAQLSSHKSVTDTLRAQTHEFSNQLHTISGLVQLGEYDAVRNLVGTLTRRRAAINDAVTQRVSDPAVAALLIAKTTLAAERRVTLMITEDSHLNALPPALATDVITVLGNLIDMQFGQARNWPLGAALSITLMAIVMIALLFYVKNASKSGDVRHG